MEFYTPYFKDLTNMNVSAKIEESKRQRRIVYDQEPAHLFGCAYSLSHRFPYDALSENGVL